MGVAQGILSAMVFWDASSWDPPSQASMQQLSGFEAKDARRAINARRQAGRTTDAQLREMLNLPAIPSVLRTLPAGTLWMQIALCRLKLSCRQLTPNLSLGQSRWLRTCGRCTVGTPSSDSSPIGMRAFLHGAQFGKSSQLCGGHSQRRLQAPSHVRQSWKSHSQSLAQSVEFFSVHACTQGAYGVRIPARRYVASSQCPIGHKDFRTRSRAIQHAHVSSIACRDALLAGEVPPLPPEVVREIDAQDADMLRKARHSGHSFLRLAGLCACLISIVCPKLASFEEFCRSTESKEERRPRCAKPSW